MQTSRPSWSVDALVAVLLAFALGVVWAWRDWTDLSALRLPDTDDAVRLQQVRDWLAGQRWGDLIQHRLGAGGVPMHWSRLADLGPAALIVALVPLLGRHGAEIAAVSVWPLMLLAGALFLTAQVARQVGDGLAGTAAVIVAIGYPATTLFVPGRIDHHGLQMVLLLGAVLATLRPPTAATGIAAGLLAAAGLVVGLETAPLLAVLGGVAAAAWVVGTDGATPRLWGLSGGALAGLAFARWAFAGDGWAYPACDVFTGDAWRAAMVLALVPPVLAACTGRVEARPLRAILAITAAALATAAALWFSPRCASPYGGLDPALATGWLARVAEAQPLLRAPAATAFGYAGLIVVGIAATLWQFGSTRRSGWAVLLVLQLGAAAVTLAQLRGAYAGALFAAPGLAALVRGARARGTLPLAGAWIASAGVLYPLAAEELSWRHGHGAPAATASCGGPELIARLAALHPGTVVGPIDLGARGLTATPHRFIAAPYHRDGAGLLAATRFFAAPPREAEAIALRWRIDYAVTCPGAPMRARGWQKVVTTGDGTIWRPPSRLRRLSDAAPAH